MANYKVIQDIEAEDKLVGPLTLRQFIYAAIAAICAYLSFIAIARGFWEILIILGPPMLFTGFFAFPWGRDQSTDPFLYNVAQAALGPEWREGSGDNHCTEARNPDIHQWFVSK
jgi:hypothetical protein